MIKADVLEGHYFYLDGRRHFALGNSSGPFPVGTVIVLTEAEFEAARQRHRDAEAQERHADIYIEKLERRIELLENTLGSYQVLTTPLARLREEAYKVLTAE